MVHVGWVPPTLNSRGLMENSGNFQANLMGPSQTALNPLRCSAEGLSVQLGGLTRYHSAPSSTFSALLESDYCPTSDSADLDQFLAQSELTEFSNFEDRRPLAKPALKQASCIKKEHPPQQVYASQNNVQLGRHNGLMPAGFQEHISQHPLSAIPEHGGEETLASQPCQHEQNVPVTRPHKPLVDSSIHYKANLIRHSSLPSEFLSRLATEDMSERPAVSQQMDSHIQAPSQQVGSHMQTTSPRTQQVGPHMQTTSPRTQQVGSHLQSASPRTPQVVSHIQTASSRASDTTGGKVYVVTSRMSPRGIPMRKCFTDEVGPCKEEDYGVLENGLIRHSSFPTGLLSQLTLDEFSNGTDKAASPSPRGLVHGGWDEVAVDSAMQKMAAFGQRKRVREADARFLKNLPAADLLMGSWDQVSSPPSNQYAVCGTSNGDSIVMNDSVLCKSRAKRGCATHPRSIAERVRRTKISERIKKLQDLVPNLDKQAHTADMLDEVVNYVKLLQQQVEELSKHSQECNGSCQEKTNNPVET